MTDFTKYGSGMMRRAPRPKPIPYAELRRLAYEHPNSAVAQEFVRLHHASSAGFRRELYRAQRAGIRTPIRP